MIPRYSLVYAQLRDIFRIHPDTACNTHDLLECPCDDAHSRALLEDEEDTDPTNNDMVGDPVGFIAASQVKPEQVNKADNAVC